MLKAFCILNFTDVEISSYRRILSLEIHAILVIVTIINNNMKRGINKWIKK